MRRLLLLVLGVLASVIILEATLTYARPKPTSITIPDQCVGGCGAGPPAWMSSGSALGTGSSATSTATITGVTAGAGKFYVTIGTAFPGNALTSVTCSAGTCGGITFAQEGTGASNTNTRAMIYSGMSSGLSGATITITATGTCDIFGAIFGVTGANASAGANGSSTDAVSPYDVSVTVPAGRSANSLLLSIGIETGTETVGGGTNTTITQQADTPGGSRQWTDRYNTDVGQGTYTLSVTGAGSSGPSIFAVEIQAQ
jgi:hypothetical protein